MSTLDQELVSSSSQDGLSYEIRDYMLETARWARFIAIIGFIGIGIMVFAGFVTMATGSMIGSSRGLNMPVGLFGLIYMAASALYFFPVLYLYKAAIGWRNGLANNNEAALTEGFRNFKSHYKFLGVFLVIVLSIYALLFLFTIVIALG